jgi:hypothetical protein
MRWAVWNWRSAALRKATCSSADTWRHLTAVTTYFAATLAEYLRRKSRFLLFWSYFRVISSARNLIPFLWIRGESNSLRGSSRVSKRRESNAESFGYTIMPDVSMCHCVRYHVLRLSLFRHMLASFRQTQQSDLHLVEFNLKHVYVYQPLLDGTRRNGTIRFV